MNLITVDMETYYDKDYGLKKLTTEEYIRDPRFETIGVSVKVNDGQTVWFSGSHEETKAFLDSYDFSGSYVLGHNMRFDAAILSWIYDIHPLGLFDTMGMGQMLYGLVSSVSLAKLAELHGIGVKGTEVLNALGKRRQDFSAIDLHEYGNYCINDVNLTYDLFNILKQKFTASEMRLIDLTIKMFTEPKLVINKGLLLRHLASVRETKANLLENAGVDKDLLMSNPKFAELLLENGVEPPMKTSITTGKQTYAFAKTDEEFKALLEHENPVVQVLTAARLGNKSTLEESRTETFIGIAERGLMPVPLKYCGAVVSHRWSGCVVEETEIIVYDVQHGVQVKCITDVLKDDLVWDGEEFVEHEGVKFSGYQEVISYGGLTATPEHVVFTECGQEIPLIQAKDAGYDIKVAAVFTQDQVESAKIKCITAHDG
jgi:DNA polymerase